ncbi:ATP-binding protein [Streptomyces sp. NPDC002138]|uniref:sensor histidine kinase n=1 Tax=Streptomyces sp. NPDC002138 TaxID=3154410 RepID=UPI0033305014
MTRHSYREGVEVGLSRSVAAVSVLFALNWVTVPLSGDRPSPGVLAVAVVFVALCLRLVVRGARVRLDGTDALAALAVAVVAHPVLALADGSPYVVIGQRCMLTAPAVLLATGFLPRTAGRWACLAALAAQLGTSWPADGPAAAVEGIWPPLATAVAGAVLAPLMRAAGDGADRSERRAAAARADAARAAARREAHRDFQGMLHDEVSAALRAIGQPGIAVDRVREAARGAVAAIASARAPGGEGGRTDLAALVRALAPAPGTGTSIVADGVTAVPYEVATATIGAAREALRNVADHARAEAVRICLTAREHRTGFVLSVTDDGAGFVREELRETSVGVRRSMMRRMEAVGGRAEVRSAPGRGTTVRLEWPAPADAERQRERAPDRSGRTDDGSASAGEAAADSAYQSARSVEADRPVEPARSVKAPRPVPVKVRHMNAAIGDVRRPLAAVCLPFLLVMGVIAVIHTRHVPGALWLTAWYAALAVITVALLLRARSGIGPAAALAACAFAVAGALGSFLVLPLAALADYTSWPIGAVTPLLTLLVIVRPAREAVAAMALEQAGLALLVLTGPPIAPTFGGTLALTLPALSAPALGVFMGMAIGRTVARLGAVTTRANAESAAALAGEAVRDAREALHRGRLADLGEEILPFLDATATGRRSPRDPEVRDTARLLGYAVRDEIHIPGVLDRPARDLLSAARTAGCVVTIQSDADDPHPPALLRLLLTTALGTGPTPRELVLSVTAAADTVDAALVVLPGDGRRASALREAVAGLSAVVEDAPESTWVEARVRTA